MNEKHRAVVKRYKQLLKRSSNLQKDFQEFRDNLKEGDCSHSQEYTDLCHDQLDDGYGVWRTSYYSFCRICKKKTFLKSVDGCQSINSYTKD